MWLWQTHLTEWITSMSLSQPALPTNRAFVVQFRAPSSEDAPAYEGRVDHLVSGEETRFHSLAELLEFMTRVLANVQQQLDAELRCASPGYAAPSGRVQV